MKQTDIILKVLGDRQWHSVFALIEAVSPGGVNVAIRSRISDLKKQGYVIDSRLNGRCAEYRLVSVPEIPTEYKTEQNGQMRYL